MRYGRWNVKVSHSKRISNVTSVIGRPHTVSTAWYNQRAVESGPKDQVALQWLHYYYTSLLYWCTAARSIEIVNFKTAAPLSLLLALQCKDFFLIPDNKFSWIYKLSRRRRNLKFKKTVKNFPHVVLNAKGWEKASWQECHLGSQTVSSGFSTFSVLWAAGMHTAVVGTG